MNFKQQIIIFLLLCSVIRSQGVGSVTGIIKESGTGAVLPGVNIMIKGTYYITLYLIKSKRPNRKHS